MGVLFLGQLWVQGIRLRAQRTWLPLVESVNQVLIFAPILVVPWLRGHGMATAWVQRSAILARLAVGFVLAMVALAIYAGLEAGAPGWLQAMRGVYTPTRLHLAVQVLLEDLSIAILFVRLAAVAGPRLAIVSVAALFAAAHVPTMVAEGATIPEFAGLWRDCGLGVLVLGTVWRSADIVWVWPVHYSLDMTQFLTGQA